MCGIAGLKIPDQAGRRALPLMLEAMRMRGPDYRQTHSFGDTSLGHCRLKIIDLSEQANQPFSNEDGTRWLIANGEVYNYRELRADLEKRGHRFKSFSDNEVILHGYEEWGVSSFLKLRGMYAFCLFDQNKDRLILARDRLGIKPLYYYHQSGVFVFASQVKALLASGVVPLRLCGQALSTYLDSGGVREPFTIIEDVVSLAPGHYAQLDASGLSVHEYWNLLDSLDRAGSTSFSRAAQETRALLEESVQFHLVSDVPLGLFLSGGIDSSSLLAAVAKVHPGKIKTVSLVFKEPAFDEREFSRLVAEKYQTDHREIEIDAENILDNLFGAIEAMDQPTFDGLNSYFVSRAAKEAGLTVVISGLGGDEVFGGYPSFRSVPALGRFSSVLRCMPGFTRSALAGMFERFSGYRPGKEKIIEFIKEGGAGTHPYFWTRRLFTGKQQQALFGGRCSDLPLFPRRLKDADIYNQVSYLEISNYMKDILLRDTDCMSMAHSLEVRVPFLDHLLVERVFSFSGRIKMGRSVNKPLLLSALNEPLPEPITKRRKMGFVLPFDPWLRGQLRQGVEGEFSDMPAALREFMSPQGVDDIWQGFLKGRISWQRPWALYVLYKWIRSNSI